MIIKNISQECVVVNFSDVTKNITDHLDNIESKLKEKYGIINYTISTSSLEDVFLKLNSNEFSKSLFDVPNTDIELKSVDNNTIEINENIINNQEDVGFCQKFKVELKSNTKRQLYSLWRDKKMFLLESIACSIFFIVIIIFNKFEMLKYYNYPSLLLKNLIMKENIQIFYNKEQIGMEEKDIRSYFEIIGNKVQLKNIQKLNSIMDFDDFIIKSEIIKHAVYINKIDENSIDCWNIFSRYAPGFLVANNNLIISSYLNKRYNIQTDFIVNNLIK